MSESRCVPEPRMSRRYAVRALVLDLAEQSGVRNGERALVREGLEEAHDLGGEAARLPPDDDEHADDPLLEKQGTESSSSGVTATPTTLGFLALV